MLFPQVNILLSTFNGTQYLREQLDSLLSQDYPNIFIHIRDDGSTDNTVDLLMSYQEKYSNIRVTVGENLGYIRSFFELVHNCEDRETELYAFCDQDDVWNPQKISRAVEKIQMSPDPSMTFYCSRMTLVDRDMKFIGVSPNPSQVDFGSAIMGFTYGCAVVIGNGIKQMFLQASPDDMLAHDWWACLIAAAFGHIVYDVEPQVNYRQHSSNASGGYRSELLPRLKFRIKELLERLFKGKPTVDFLNQAEKFIMTYDNIHIEKRYIIEELLILKKENNQMVSRLCYIFNPKLHAINSVDNAFLKLTILFGRH
ncbi:glycosyltransferase family 2 protein [Chamaesiphon polymorphus]|uniref:Glycosyltransferase 2-like domain-containing protein n=1 Tax=Chamaesiphon polymorphus CCALA 037 TaxID=2107692 RepID=A0A2T1GMZ0_9CYAN|nr:glycosyltransferase family 2 protein [Chamaesiphon polymorphus]PSB59237.1 hypothetical protein C7B77_01680 [Chamaesiphon polymorphus CCALA 037]